MCGRGDAHKHERDRRREPQLDGRYQRRASPAARDSLEQRQDERTERERERDRRADVEAAEAAAVACGTQQLVANRSSGSSAGRSASIKSE